MIVDLNERNDGFTSNRLFLINTWADILRLNNSCLLGAYEPLHPFQNQSSFFISLNKTHKRCCHSCCCCSFSHNYSFNLQRMHFHSLHLSISSLYISKPFFVWIHQHHSSSRWKARGITLKHKKNHPHPVSFWTEWQSQGRKFVMWHKKGIYQIKKEKP